MRSGPSTSRPAASDSTLSTPHQLHSQPSQRSQQSQQPHKLNTAHQNFSASSFLSTKNPILKLIRKMSLPNTPYTSVFVMKTNDDTDTQMSDAEELLTPVATTSSTLVTSTGTAPRPHGSLHLSGSNSLFLKAAKKYRPKRGSSSLGKATKSKALPVRIDEGFFSKSSPKLDEDEDKDIPRIDFISRLPYEIASYIMHFVNLPTLTRMSQVSKTWYQVTRDNDIWKNLYLCHKQWKIYVGPESYSSASSQSLLNLNWYKLLQTRYILERRWQKGETNTRPLAGHQDSVYCIQFDSQKIVTGSRDRTIKFWDIKTRKNYMTLNGHDASVLCLQYCDSRQIMISGSSDATIIVWDLKTFEPKRRLRGHSAGVLDICFSDKYIVSCSKDATIRVWSLSTGQFLRVLVGHRGPVNAVQLHGTQCISASGDALIKLWNVETGAHIRDFVGHNRGLACVQFNGRIVVSGSNDHTIRVWDARTGECLRVLDGHTDLVRTLCFDESLGKIVSGSYDQSIRVWDLETGKQLYNFASGHSSWVFDVGFNLERIVSTSQDKKILIMDFAEGLDTKYLVPPATASSDGRPGDTSIHGRWRSE